MTNEADDDPVLMEVAKSSEPLTAREQLLLDLAAAHAREEIARLLDILQRAGRI